MTNIALVAIGGAIGSILRYLAAIGAARLAGPDWPYGTVFVNVTGSFLMGVVVELIARRFNASVEIRLFVATGILGGYTTFSSFSLDASSLFERGGLTDALAYVLASVVLGILALFAGLAFARHLA